MAPDATSISLGETKFVGSSLYGIALYLPARIGKIWSYLETIKMPLSLLLYCFIK